MEQNVKRLVCDFCGESVDVNGSYNGGFQKVQLPCKITTTVESSVLACRIGFHECDICSNCFSKLWNMFRDKVAEINYDTEDNKTKVNLKYDIASE